MITLKSTNELLLYIASNNLLEFDYQTAYGYTETNFIWKEESIKRKILEANPNLEEELTNYFIEELIVPIIDFHDQYYVKPIIKHEKMMYEISSYLSDMTINEIDPEGEESMIVYLEKILPELNEFDFLENLDSNNFDSYLKFSYESGDASLEIFDVSDNSWIDFDEHESGDEVLDILCDLFRNYIENDYDKAIISDNIIKYYLENQRVGEEFLIEDFQSEWDDNIIYNI